MTLKPDWLVETPENQKGYSVPLNSTMPNLASWAARAVLTIGAAQTITFDPKTTTIEFIPSDIPTAPIFIKRGTLAWQTAASATVFDDIITPAKPAIQVWVAENCPSYSIFGTSGTVYTIER